MIPAFKPKFRLSPKNWTCSIERESPEDGGEKMACSCSLMFRHCLPLFVCLNSNHRLLLYWHLRFRSRAKVLYMYLRWPGLSSCVC